MKQIFRSFPFLMAALLTGAAAGSLEAQLTLGASPSSVTLAAQSGSAASVTQMIAISSSGDPTGNFIQFSAFASVFSGGTNWLTITSATTGTTPGSITISANPSGLASGAYQGEILIFADTNNVNNSPLTVPVTFTIGQLIAVPASLSFSYQSGGSVPAGQSVAVSGPATPVGFSAATSVASGANWLQVAPTSGTTPATVTVSLNPTVIAGLAAGSYTGNVTLTPASGLTTPVIVPVTLTVSVAPQLTASPANLSFLYQIGGSNNTLQQTVALASTGEPVTFGAPSVNQPWLVATPSGSVTPATLTVGLSTATLTTPGNFTGMVTLVSGGATLNIPVSVLVSNSPLLSFTPGSLSFTYATGNTAPAAQSITPTSTGVEVSYTATAATAGGGNWLTVTPSGTTPSPIIVSIDPTVLPPVSQTQTFTGAITITAPLSGNSPQQIPVTLTVTNTVQLEASPAALTFLYQTGLAVPAAQAVAVITSTGDVVNYSVTAATMSGGNWLSAAPVTGTTPGTFNVSVNTNGLATGTYTGTVTVGAPGNTEPPVGPVTIPVTCYVSGNALLAVSPTALSFNVSAGAVAPAQTVSLTSTSDPLNYTITSSTVTGGPWLAVSSQPGTTPGSFFVSAEPFGLAAGTYAGSITVTATNPSGAPVADSPFTIPVTLVVTSGALTAAPATLAFTQALGGAAPASQAIMVTNTGTGNLNFIAVATTSAGVNWLSVTPSAATTPATLTAAANGSTLSVGTYAGLITITSPGAAGSPQVVQVTLTVTALPSVSVTPASLSFSAPVGGAAPAAQTLQVTSSGAALAFTAAASTTGNSGNWLSVTPAGGTTPGALSVAVSPGSLAAGSYTGAITVTAAGAGNSPQTVPVTLTVTPAVAPLVMTVQNSASQSLGPVAPGELISIYGTNLGGPAGGAGGTVTGNMLGTMVADTQVFFDNIAAPLLYVSNTQINAVVPFELYGRFQTQLQVVHAGTPSTTIDLNVANTAPGLFTVAQNGSGPGAILNTDLSLNTTANPAPQGSIILLYGTGGGQTTPPGVTGNVTPGNGTDLKIVPGVTAMVGGQPATVQYAGTAPGFVEGGMQINVQLPPSLPSGPQPVTIAVGGVTSPTGVTVVIQ